jgi:hypothetical protein
MADALKAIRAANGTLGTPQPVAPTDEQHLDDCPCAALVRVEAER